MANIYAPNEDDPNFFQFIFDQLLSFKCEEIIIQGDFNLVLDVEKDEGWPRQNTPKSIKGDSRFV